MKLKILLIFLFIPGFLCAQNRIYVNEYLNIGVGARALGMAGANAASGNDVYSGFWNPAALMQVEDDVQVGLMHSEYFAGIFKYDYGAVAMPIKNKSSVVGLSFIRFATDNIPYTLDYIQPDGSFDDSKLRGFSAGDYAVTFSYAQKIPIFKKNPLLLTTGGANLKVIYRNVGSMANAWGFGIDLGFKTQYKAWQFGLMLKDITTTYTAWSFHLTEKEKQIFAATNNEIPIKSYELMFPRLNFGIARNFLSEKSDFQFLGELGFDVTTDGKRATLIASKTFSIDPKFGLEAGYKKTLFLRAGLGNFYRVLDNTDTINLKKVTIFQPSIGAGFKVKGLSVDYAFTSLQMQDNSLISHVISLRVDINKQRKPSQELQPEPEIEPKNIIQK